MPEHEPKILIPDAGERIIMPTAEESKAIDEQIASGPDDFEMDDAWFEDAKTTQELFPEAYEQAVRQEEALKAGLIQRVTITLDRETIAWFKAQTGEDGETGGTRWLELVAQTLRDHGRGQCRPEVTFAAYQGLIPPGTTSRKTPAEAHGRPRMGPVQA